MFTKEALPLKADCSTFKHNSDEIRSSFTANERQSAIRVGRTGGLSQAESQQRWKTNRALRVEESPSSPWGSHTPAPADALYLPHLGKVLSQASIHAGLSTWKALSQGLWSLVQCTFTAFYTHWPQCLECPFLGSLVINHLLILWDPT